VFNFIDNPGSEYVIAIVFKLKNTNGFKEYYLDKVWPIWSLTIIES
jgi:hypothetical protein